MKKLKRKTKRALAICAERFVLGKEDATAKASMQHAIPAPKHEQLAASESVDGEEGDEAREEFPGQGAAGEDAGDFRIESQTLLENDLVKCVSTTGLLA
jgi:hypothetical protein